MARLGYPAASDVAEVMRRFPAPLRSMNIARIVSHAPTLAGPYYNTYAAAFQSLELDPKLRQLAILRVAERAAAPYVLVQHRALSKLARLTDEQIAAAGQPSVDNACFTHIQKIVLSFVDEVIAGPQISNPVFERVRSVLTPREIVELLLVIGWYWTACRLTSALEIEPEHPLGHGVVAMLQFEQAKRSGELADAIRADASADIPPLGDLVY